MARMLTTLLLVPALLAAPAALAQNPSLFNHEIQDCYSKAMIGLDSVINSRLGLPPEHALELASNTQRALYEENNYYNDVLIVILAAYSWDESPHNYAIKVFYSCAKGGRPLTATHLGGEVWEIPGH